MGRCYRWENLHDARLSLFYTNLPQWDKNWLWRGDDLWHDRWQQIIEMQPSLVEVTG